MDVKKTKEDSEIVYDLLLKALISSLKGKSISPAVMKVALDFIKTYELDAPVIRNKSKEDNSKDVKTFIESLPFKIVN